MISEIKDLLVSLFSDCINGLLKAIGWVLTAHRAAQQEAFMQSPSVEEKMWKHTGVFIHTPRENHKEMDNKRVSKDKPFELIGANREVHYPMFPGDTNLPPEERIHCHCISQAIINKDILGLSLEERQRLQQEAMDEMDKNWKSELEAKNKAKVGL